MPAPTLRLRELLAMGVGGMIGGGIFSVLGLAVRESGNAAPLAFLSGALIAWIAGRAYVHLALAYREDGASFTYLERAFPRHLAVAGVAALLTSLGNLEMIASFSSMTFLLVSMGMCIASWRLRRETGARPLGVGSALLLLGVALVLLVAFLAERDRSALAFCGTVYAAVVMAHLLFERFGRAPASR